MIVVQVRKKNDAHICGIAIGPDHVVGGARTAIEHVFCTIFQSDQDTGLRPIWIHHCGTCAEHVNFHNPLPKN